MTHGDWLSISGFVFVVFGMICVTWRISNFLIFIGAALIVLGSFVHLARAGVPDGPRKTSESACVPLDYQPAHP